MTFTTVRLVGSQVIVRGTDVFGTNGETVLDSSQWDEINADKAFSQAAEDFDRTVEAFFAPLTEAADKLHKKLEQPTDSVGYVVLQEKVEGTQAQSEQLIKLTPDSVVLRLLEQGDASRLVWVNDSLQVLAASATVSTPVTTESSVNDKS